MDEPVDTEHPTAPGDQGRRLDAVVAELDSLLGALGDVDLADDPVPFSAPHRETGVTANGRVEPSDPPQPALRDLEEGHGLPPVSSLPPAPGLQPAARPVADPAAGVAPVPASDPATRPTGAQRFLTRRSATFIGVTLLATLLAYLVGTTLGGVTGPKASPDDTSVTAPTVQVVSHEFSGDGPATTVWFTAIADFQIASIGADVPSLVLEAEDGGTQPVPMEGDLSTAIGPGKYRILVDAPGAWSLHVLRVVGA